MCGRFWVPCRSAGSMLRPWSRCTPSSGDAGERCSGRRQAGHACRPLAPATIRLVHANLSAALSSAVRWRWLAVNAATQAARPTVPKSDPQAPSGEQAARIVVEAWKDPDWGMLVWLVMVTGARRGKLCALRWDRVDFTTGVLQIRSSIAQFGATTWEKDTMTHQQRRITLDPQTLALLRTYHARRVDMAAAVGVGLPSDARIFSPVPDGSEWVKPDTVGQRYMRMCARLGWDMHLHQLRHYSATELIAAGVDVRTVAGRLGHGGGGTTTLKVYSAWRSEGTSVRRARSACGCRHCLSKLIPKRRWRARRWMTTTTRARTGGSWLTYAAQ